MELFFFDFLLGAESVAAEAPRDSFGLEGLEVDLDEDRDGALEEGVELPEREEAPSVSMASASWSVRNRGTRSWKI